MDVLDGRANNFTLMRLLAGIGVLYFHDYPLSGGEKIASAYLPEYQNLILMLGRYSVDMFFVISGFLVTGSYLNRGNLYAFLEARILRLYPGLIVANLLSVFVIGALATNLPLSAYFMEKETYSFLLKNTLLLNDIQLQLPGVFSSNPYPGQVNGSLWTLTVEIRMYLCVAILGATSILRSTRIFNVFFVALIIQYLISLSTQILFFHESHQVRVALLFLVGAFFYINRSVVPLNMTWLMVFAGFAFLMQGSPFYNLAHAVFFAYLIIFLAYHPRLRIYSLDQLGDISYGVYIYAFPTQQLIAYYYNGITPSEMLFLALPLTCALAIMSWGYIERPALGLKGKILHFGLFRNNKVM